MGTSHTWKKRVGYFRVPSSEPINESDFLIPGSSMTQECETQGNGSVGSFQCLSEAAGTVMFLFYC